RDARLFRRRDVESGCRAWRVASRHGSERVAADALRGGSGRRDTGQARAGREMDRAADAHCTLTKRGEPKRASREERAEKSEPRGASREERAEKSEPRRASRERR